MPERPEGRAHKLDLSPSRSPIRARCSFNSRSASSCSRCRRDCSAQVEAMIFAEQLMTLDRPGEDPNQVSRGGGVYAEVASAPTS